MQIVGLTGGIASGKSTVAAYIEQKYHWPVIDADHLSHQISQQLEIKQKIVTQFGNLTRRQLAKLIFTDPAAKTALEKILHPPIIQTIKYLLRVLEEWGSGAASKITPFMSSPTSPAPTLSSAPSFVLLVAPLLVETELRDLCDYIIVLDLPPSIQFSRLLTRQPALDTASAQQILSAQTPPSKRNQFATVIINNSTTPETLFSQVDQVISRIENH